MARHRFFPNAGRRTAAQDNPHKPAGRSASRVMLDAACTGVDAQRSPFSDRSPPHRAGNAVVWLTPGHWDLLQ